MSNYALFDTFSDAMVAFSRICRSKGLYIGINHTIEALQSTLHGLWLNEIWFQYGLRSLYCHKPEDYPVFDLLFAQFWKAKGSIVQSKTTYRNQSNLRKSTQASLVMVGLGDDRNSIKKEAKHTSGANKKSTLRKTDFAKIADIDSLYLEELAEQLWRQMALRIKRKRKKSLTGSIDIQKTIRKNIQYGGLPLRLLKTRKDRDKFKLVILLDVSGSMDKYSFYLLKFIYTLRHNFEDLEAFIFSTRIIRITELLDKRNIHRTLDMMKTHADHWSSGTQIGACLQYFNQHYAKKALNRRSITVLLSDGLDTGEPALLAHELERIRLRTNKLIWLNPLKGMEGYRPIQRGMSAALPSLDEFRTAHNLDSLLALENLLTHV